MLIDLEPFQGFKDVLLYKAILVLMTRGNLLSHFKTKAYVYLLVTPHLKASIAFNLACVKIIIQVLLCLSYHGHHLMNVFCIH